MKLSTKSLCAVLCIPAGLLGITLSTNLASLDAQPKANPVKPDIKTVRDFGAKGDGKTDDTAAIQRAVDSRIGEVRFPRGVYRITRPIVIDLEKVGPTSVVADGTARIVMAGAGPALKFVGTHGGTASPKTVKPNVWERQRTPMVDGIEIVGAHEKANGIEATGTMQMIFTRVTVRKALHGIHLTTRNRNVIVSECHLYENRGVGLFLDHLNLHQVNVTNCHISYNDMGGIVVRDSEVRNLQIGTCDIEGNMGDDNEPTANILIDTTNGSVREGAITGCTIQHNHTAPDSANIRFIGRSAELPLKVGYFSISDNALSDVAVNVHLKHARGVLIQGNSFWKAFKHNLLVEGSSNIVVGPNLFDRNPDYRPYDSANGLLFRDCADCTLSGLHINGTLTAAAGLILEDCRWFNVTGCTILNCENSGLLLKNVEQSRVSDCLIRGARSDNAAPTAIVVTGGKGNMIVDNRFAGEAQIPPESAEIRGNRGGN